ncbi:MAG: M28 family metallopeptidase [Candidatus Aminicenantes bacterium]|nr:M28 family metallopeptidase [Candidatus Aminicenantes bacterium]
MKSKLFVTLGKNVCRFCLTVLAITVFLFFVFSSQKAASLSNEEISLLQQDIMAKLTGKTEITQGVLMPNRSTIENRIITRDYLFGLLQEFGYKALRHTYSDEGENVYAILKSTSPSDEYILLGAHYDTVRDCPGANDNGTGVVAVLTLARTLSQLEDRSKNLIIILFDQEERGMLGSKQFAQKLKDENMNVHSVHTIDQMGWDEDGDRAFELEIPYEGAVDLYEEAVHSQGKQLTIHITSERGSDHSAFRRLEFKATGITEEYRNSDTTPHIHRSTDTYDTINFDYLLSTTLIFEEAIKSLLRS